MANENELQILIRILSEKVGAEEAKAILNEVKVETEKTGQTATESAKEQKHAQSELKKEIKEVAREIPGVGLAWKVATNPISATVTVFTLAVAGLKKGFDDFKTAMAQGDWETGAKAAGAYAEALQEVDTEMAKINISMAGMNQAENSVSTGIAVTVKRLEEEFQAWNKVNEARKQAELAAAKTPAEAEAIEGRYAAKTIEQRRKYAAAQMEQKNLEMGTLAKVIPQTEDEARAAQQRIGELKAREAELSAQKAGAEKNIATAEAERKKAQDYMASPDLLRMDPGGVYQRAARDTIEKTTAVIAGNKSLLGAIEPVQGRVTYERMQAEAEQARRLGSLGSMNQRRNALEAEMLTDAGTESRTRRTESTVESLRHTTALQKQIADLQKQIEQLSNRTVEVQANTGQVTAANLEQLHKLNEQMNALKAQTKANPAMN